MSTVKVYVTDYCPYCTAAKAYLEKMGVAYETIDVSRDAEMRMKLAELSGQRTVPQIFVGDVSVGGFTDLRALDQKGELRPLLAQHGVVLGS